MIHDHISMSLIDHRSPIIDELMPDADEMGKMAGRMICRLTMM